ncbi:MAG: FecR domain-containing protein [Burkholderiales bacterium]|nr:FecR domain-containing protein [Burkholderiales bacterium]
MNTPLRSLTLTIALAIGVPFAALAADPVGKVIFQSGGAMIVDAAGKQRPASKGDLIMPGERLVTGDNALTQVKMRDGSFVGLRPGTDLKFQEMRLAGKDAGQDVALTSGSIRVLNLPGDGTLKPVPVNVQAGDARIVLRGADMESSVKRDRAAGVETITRLNHGVGTLSNGLKTLDLPVNGVSSATKERIVDAPITALPPIDLRPLANAGSLKTVLPASLSTQGGLLKTDLPKTDIAVLAPDLRGGLTSKTPVADIVVPPRSLAITTNPTTGLLDLAVTGTPGKAEMLPTSSLSTGGPSLTDTIDKIVKLPTSTVPIIDPSKVNLPVRLF